MRTQVRGAEAIITDGGVRDLDAVSALDIPTFHNGAHPAVLGRKHVPWDTDVAVGCGGTTIVPGDIVIADADGVLVIPPHLAAEIAEEVVESERQDTFVFLNVKNGNKIEGLFPMNTSWKTKYNQWVADGEPEF